VNATVAPRATETIAAALNTQIKHELDSAYFYLSASAYFEALNLAGFAGWMRAQSREEVGHGMKLFDFLGDRGARVQLRALDEPPSDFSSPADAFKRALEHEREVTSLIHDLYALAQAQRDYPAQVLLQWFIDEQVEEEKSTSRIVDQLKMAGDNSAALLLLDRELGARRDEAE
jgi:ferritin